MLHNLEALKEAQARSLATAAEENRIFEALPIPPRRVGFGDSTMPWVTYEAKTLEEALVIFKAYEPESWVIANSGSCTVLGPDSVMSARYGKPGKEYSVRSEIEDGAPYFDVMQGVGFSSAEMEFYTRCADRMLKICVRIEQCPIQVRLVPLSPFDRSRHKDYRKNCPTVAGARVIQWGYGDDCVKATYWYANLDDFWASMSTFVSGDILPV